MPETTTPNSDTTPEPTAEKVAKTHFAKAVEEAKAGAQALGKEAQERAGAYREKASQTGSEWANEARAKSGEAKEKAFAFANEGKAGASKAISTLGKMVEDNAPTIDDKLGAKYGDYARSAARSMQDAATKLDTKELNELGEDAKDFVRKSPGLAVGMAAVAGFMLARLFRGSSD
ncbi:MAG: hypothetical protein H6917_09285 [Novosphingobium sp.]|nr:hypothetical protein [Novosphingobium sp.]MCP5402568.1 hypothetical protein [Novosphingobium sp.]